MDRARGIGVDVGPLHFTVIRDRCFLYIEADLFHFYTKLLRCLFMRNGLKGMSDLQKSTLSVSWWVRVRAGVRAAWSRPPGERVQSTKCPPGPSPFNRLASTLVRCSPLLTSSASRQDGRQFVASSIHYLTPFFTIQRKRLEVTVYV